MVDRLYQDPAQILQQLIRFDTTNPPGNETECVGFIAGLLQAAGLDPIMLGKTPERQNLVVKLPGRGVAPPLLMYGHADVVTAQEQLWQVPPFEGIIDDGCVWGRGALDMKGALAMMLSALLRVKQEGAAPPGDIVFAVVCDEENGGVFGAKYLTEEHAGLFQGIDYAISELGGFTLHMCGKRFYPIMVSEKHRCSFEVTVTGAGGHGSMPVRGGAMAKAAEILHTLDTTRLPVHITPPVKMSIQALAKNLPFPASLVFSLLLKPRLTNTILSILGERAAYFDPLLHNTLSATVIRGGDMLNVIPGEVKLVLDGRILPTLEQARMIEEVETLLGNDADINVTYFLPGPSTVDMGLFERLADILREFDQEAIPIPFVGIGVSDARYFCKLGIQTYGFTPMLLPKDIEFSRLIHGADERIPLEALEFGTNCVHRLLVPK